MVKNLPANTGDARDTRDARDVDSIPGSGRSLGVGNGISLQYSCLKSFTDSDPGGLQIMGPHIVRHNQAHTHTHTTTCEH